MDINSVILVGRLTRDCQMRYASSGLPICEFSLAVNRRKKEEDNWVDEVSFFSITLFGRQGEALQRYLLKGKQIGVQGELRQDKWEQDGQKRSKVVIIANNVQLLGAAREQPGGSPGVENPSSSPGGGSAGNNMPSNFEDDIPF